MPYTFGGATTDDITFSSVITIGASLRCSIVTGWWYPTTLTATRGLWSAGNTIGVEIDATTDELRLRTDNTTDGQWTTTGVDLAVNEWKFLAFALSTHNTGVLAAWRVWAGTIATAPQAVTVTGAVTPVGSFTGSASFYIGNKGTGSLAFQGDVADVAVAVTDAQIGGANINTNPFGLAAYGAITDPEALWIYETMVIPAWLGESAAIIRQPSIGALTAWHCGLDNLPTVVGRSSSATSSALPPLTPTINGATWSQNGAPRPNPGMDTLPRPRR